MVKKSIIEDVLDTFGIKFDREAFAKNYAEAKELFTDRDRPRPALVDRLTKRETYANLYAQDDGRESLKDAIGPETEGGQAFFGVRGLHHAITRYLKDRERDAKRRGERLVA